MAASAVKAIEDEQMALLREENQIGSSSSKLIDSAAFEEESKIEQASDDSDDEAVFTPSKRRNNRRVDSDFNAEGVEHAEDSDEAPLDDLEPENIDDHFEDERNKKKQKAATEKATTRRHRTEVDEANLMGDEQEETVFIDNLPNDEQGIKSMLLEVRRNIINLEKQFLMEEDSDAEEDEKLLESFQADVNLQQDDDMPVVKKIEAARQFFCVPLLADVMNFEFERLG